MTEPTPLTREILAGFHKSSLEQMGWTVQMTDATPPPPAPTPLPTPTPSPARKPWPGGAFITDADLDRAKMRMSNEPYATWYRAARSRAEGLLSMTPDVFVSPDMDKLVFGWTSGSTQSPNSLRVAVDKLRDDSDSIRRLALEYALSGDVAFADKAKDVMIAWAARHTPVNPSHFNPDFLNADFDGKTPGGYTSDRPWNMMLDSMWQTYGLINVSDAYLLLKTSGYTLGLGIRDWIEDLAHAVNGGLHCWTKWGDLHPTSRSYDRYRSDNHLTWALAGLLAAGVALEDDALRSYVLSGGVWNGYANPSHIRDVIDRAVEAGAEPEAEGRIYEELIRRTPTIQYAIFHLRAMCLVAQIAKAHNLDDIWNFEGADKGSILTAAQRYAAFALGERQSPQAGEGPADAHFVYEMIHREWNTPRFRDVVAITDRSRHFREAIGPVAFLLGR